MQWKLCFFVVNSNTFCYFKFCIVNSYSCSFLDTKCVVVHQLVSQYYIYIPVMSQTGCAMAVWSGCFVNCHLKSVNRVVLQSVSLCRYCCCWRAVWCSHAAVSESHSFDKHFITVSLLQFVCWKNKDWLLHRVSPLHAVSVKLHLRDRRTDYPSVRLLDGVWH